MLQSFVGLKRDCFQSQQDQFEVLLQHSSSRLNTGLCCLNREGDQAFLSNNCNLLQHLMELAASHAGRIMREGGQGSRRAGQTLMVCGWSACCTAPHNLGAGQTGGEAGEVGPVSSPPSRLLSGCRKKMSKNKLSEFVRWIPAGECSWM